MLRVAQSGCSEIVTEQNKWCFHVVIIFRIETERKTVLKNWVKK